MKRFFRILTILIMCLSLSGCGDGGSIYSNYREVEQLQLIRTLGIDRPGELVEVTISSGRAAGEGQGSLLSLRGASVAEAMQSMDDYASGKQLFYAHARHLIIGEETARDGIGEFLGYIQRSTALRMSIELYIVRGDDAKSLMTASDGEDYEISETMSAVSRDVRRSGRSHAFTCTETARALSESGAALVCALSAAPTEGVVFSEASGATAVPDGFGILVGDRLVGFIDERDAVAACILTGNGGLTAITLPDGDGGIAGVTLEDARAEFTPVWEGDELREIKCEIFVDSVLAELSQPQPELSPELLSRLSTALGQEIFSRAGNVLALERGLSADFLGIGRLLRAQGSAKFDSMSPAWPQCLEDIGFSLSVNAAVGRSSDLDGSAGTEGGIFSYAGNPR